MSALLISEQTGLFYFCSKKKIDNHVISPYMEFHASKVKWLTSDQECRRYGYSDNFLGFCSSEEEFDALGDITLCCSSPENKLWLQKLRHQIVLVGDLFAFAESLSNFRQSQIVQEACSSSLSGKSLSLDENLSRLFECLRLEYGR